MESGTILHLALLRKLSSNTPQCNYTNKFVRFRNNIRSRTPNIPNRSQLSAPLSFSSLFLGVHSLDLPQSLFMAGGQIAHRFRRQDRFVLKRELNFWHPVFTRLHEVLPMNLVPKLNFPIQMSSWRCDVE